TLVAALGVVLVPGGVAALLVGGQETPEGDHGAGRPEGGGAVVLGELQLDRRGGALGVGHLGGDGALPDQLVEAELIAREGPGHLGRGAEAVPGGTDRLVRLLGVPPLGLV